MSHAHEADAHGIHEAPPEHQHHFETPTQQFESGKLGMWVFLATEILLFGGLFCAYAVYRSLHPEVFVYASLFLDRVLGGINTVVLICSSLTMALGVRAAQLGQRKLLLWMLALTIVGGFGFMGIKYAEYKHKWESGLLWGTNYVSQKDGHAFTHGAEHGGSGHGDAAPSSHDAAPPATTPA
ncbi:MAG: cytochrome c oxidase subunit 3 family protein, partial [Acidobacteria bacterium]|nr:cytochrome c oxidase subunit 3 family protein [Acidobacteriota bacterium]